METTANTQKTTATKTSAVQAVGLYLSRQADGLGRYLLEQTLYFLFGWVPTIVGVGLRAVFYRLILKMDGLAAIESGVRLRFLTNSTLKSRRSCTEKLRSRGFEAEESEVFTASFVAAAYLRSL